MLLTACSGTEVASDYDKHVDFSSYKTFSVCLLDLEVENKDKLVYDNPVNRVVVKQAIETEMKKRYSLNDTAADLLAGFHIAIKDNKFTYLNCRGGDNYRTWPECKLDTREYTEGTLIVYVTDLKKDQVIWQASASGVLDDALVKDEKLIRKTINRLFDEFPLKAKE